MNTIIRKGTTVSLLTTNGGAAVGTLQEDYRPSYSVTISRPSGGYFTVLGWRVRSVTPVEAQENASAPMKGAVEIQGVRVTRHEAAYYLRKIRVPGFPVLGGRARQYGGSHTKYLTVYRTVRA
jgi:hypothetical protein